MAVDHYWICTDFSAVKTAKRHRGIRGLLNFANELPHYYLPKSLVKKGYLQLFSNNRNNLN
ncbi:hypothetical protein ENHYD8BJ_30017 [Enhydrobacter sp. 8BJ]|nr:hypothetical protein ENHYD8BJ_30017 [Enhydrobacter sp. 8BJ]